ncbi:uncharacterized protein VP01_6829g1 [Puccinia sorghi]|uniref:Uncharacterized protein n=1 Tax=Puccinia sorghi TaxID=27349 RepID=A0A0L6UEJ5_9BASI|nr:uncharacterized protein VP01_6829g1 [Puccinia sorghi]
MPSNTPPPLNQIPLPQGGLAEHPGTVSNYTQDFNQHARAARWPDTLLMSLYQNGLKENVQLAVVMSNVHGPDHQRHPTSPPRP